MLTREIFRQWLLIAVPVSRTRFATIFCLPVTKTGRRDRQKIYLSKCFVTAWTPGELLTGKYGRVQHKLLRLSGKAVLLPKYILWEGRLINFSIVFNPHMQMKKGNYLHWYRQFPLKLFCYFVSVSASVSATGTVEMASTPFILMPLTPSVVER